MSFLFDYGDGSSENVTGYQLPEMYVDMTMCGKGKHVYTEGKKMYVNPIALIRATTH